MTVRLTIYDLKKQKKTYVRFEFIYDENIYIWIFQSIYDSNMTIYDFKLRYYMLKQNMYMHDILTYNMHLSSLMTAYMRILNSHVCATCDDT